MNPFYPNIRFYYRLHYALEVLNCPINIIRTLLESRYTDVNLLEERCREPLHMAISLPHAKPEVIRLLLQRNADINSTNALSETPLHLALKKSCYRFEIVKELLAYDADVNARDAFNNTPLHLAAGNYRNDTRVIEALLDKGADVKAINKILDNPLHIALMNPKCDVNIVRLLIKEVDLSHRNYFRFTPLLLYLWNKNCQVEVVKELLNHGALLCDLHERYSVLKYALHFAVVSTHNYAIVSAIVNKLSKMSLSCDIIDIINHKTFDLNTPLHKALGVINVDERIISLLLTYGATVNEMNFSNDTPLIIASRSPSCNFAVIQMLLESGASMDAYKSEDKSPYKCMIDKYDMDPVKYKTSTWLMTKYVVKNSSKKYIHNPEIDFNYILEQKLTCCVKSEDSRKSLRKFIRKCCEELVEMSTDMLSDRFSLYDFITDEEKKIKFEDLEMLQSILVKIDKYPIYCSLIVNCFERSDLQNVLSMQEIYTTYSPETESSEEFKIKLLPDCINRISIYLSKKDLVNAAIAFHESYCPNDTDKMVNIP